MLDFLLVMALGFLGSFGHCISMCGPLTVAFSLTPKKTDPITIWQQLYFHGLLNLGRLTSYVLVGAGIGAIGSVLIASGQLAGIGSSLRQGLAILTGGFLIWMGLVQINPKQLPHFPLLHPILQTGLHQKLSSAMMQLSLHGHSLTPALLGMTWGLIPCGFLYAAQIKAAESGDLWKGASIMLAFGLGTVPSMLGAGVSASLMTADRRSQLFRCGGWVLVLTGGLTLARTDNAMSSDWTGHLALFCLILALAARPISQLWAVLLGYRRILGIGAFFLALAHTLHMVQHTLSWNLGTIAFMLPEQQGALWAGLGALILMLPSVCTSNKWMMEKLGQHWRSLHLLNLPVLILSVWHTIGLGSHYIGGLEKVGLNGLRTVLLIGLVLGIFLVRCRWFWTFIGLEQRYTPPFQIMSQGQSQERNG